MGTCGGCDGSEEASEEVRMSFSPSRSFDIALATNAQHLVAVCLELPLLSSLPLTRFAFCFPAQYDKSIGRHAGNSEFFS